MVQALPGIAAGTAVETAQSDEGITYAKKIRPREARIDWRRPAAEVDCRIRGLSPAPGAWFVAESERGPVRIKALLSQVEDGDGAPGDVLDDRLLIACGTGAVRILTVQREGRGVQALDDFVRGFRVEALAR
jgi:methionyl-tRNA formyltransferase